MTKNNTSEAALKADLQQDQETSEGVIESTTDAKSNTNVLAEYMARQEELEKMKPAVVSALQAVIASNQQALDLVTGKKKVSASKDGAETRDPSIAVFEEYLADPSKLKDGMIKVRDWKSTMRPAVINFAKAAPGYELVINGAHKYVKLAPKGTGDEASAPQNTTEANPPAATKEAAQPRPIEANAPVVPEKAAQPTTAEAKPAVPTQEAA